MASDQTETSESEVSQTSKFSQSFVWGAPIVSIIIIVGFVILSVFAIKPELANISDKSVILYLLGAWQSLATMAAAYWLGSSAGSADKGQQIANMTKTQMPPPAVVPHIN